jgi:hypothetical protein
MRLYPLLIALSLCGCHETKALPQPPVTGPSVEIQVAPLPTPTPAPLPTSKVKRQPRYQGRTIEEWIEVFQDQHDATREIAVSALSAFGKEAVPAVIQELERTSEYIRIIEICSILNASGRDAIAAEPALRSALKRQPKTAQWVNQTLAVIGAK